MAATKKTITKAESKKTATKGKTEQKRTQPVPTVNNYSTDNEQSYDDLPAVPELNMKERVRRKTGGRQKGRLYLRFPVNYRHFCSRVLLKIGGAWEEKKRCGLV